MLQRQALLVFLIGKCQKYYVDVCGSCALAGCWERRVFRLISARPFQLRLNRDGLMMATVSLEGGRAVHNYSY
eukprot:2680945-Rhodomonas_salina.1